MGVPEDDRLADVENEPDESAYPKAASILCSCLTDRVRLIAPLPYRLTVPVNVSRPVRSASVKTTFSSPDPSRPV